LDEALYFVFRFRMEPPHPAARDGVMAGVVGPYLVEGNAVTYRGGIAWSDFEPYVQRSPEERVARLHGRVLQQGLERSLAAGARSGAA
jgi:hypothetical protein